MARRGRKPKSKEQKQADAMDRTAPNIDVLRRRALFSFVQPPPANRLDGRNGEIDSEICDAIGQFHALGLLDGHGLDPTEMRDRGRFWRDQYTIAFRAQGFKGSNLERQDRGVDNSDRKPSRDEMLFKAMNDVLRGFERGALLSLLVDPLVGSDPMGRRTSPWAKSLIDEALLKRGKCPDGPVQLPSLNDRALLDAAIRGLFAIVDAAMPGRYERRAA